MGVYDLDNPDSGDVTIRSGCVDKLITVFTDDPHSLEKCVWDTFKVAGDMNSQNERLEEDA